MKPAEASIFIVFNRTYALFHLYQDRRFAMLAIY